MGWCWCWPKKRLQDGYDLEHFLDLRLPIFWVMGPPDCGKTTIATALARSSKYRLIKISQLIKDEIARNEGRGKHIASFTKDGYPCPNEIILNLLKEIFYMTCDESEGYILDGFPLDLQQGKQFEFEICKVFIIIYPTLTTDAYLSRYLTRGGRPQDAEIIREKHSESSKTCQEIYRNYEQKTLKCITMYETRILVNALIDDLYRYFGYSFTPIGNSGG